MNVTSLRRRLRESVSASAEPQLQRGTDLEESAPTQAERDTAAKNGDAFSDGAYPITTQKQADDAWGLRNNSKTHSEASVVAHIRKQVKKHGLTMPTTGDESKTKESDETNVQLGLLLREASIKKDGGVYEVTIVREGPGHSGGPDGGRFYTKQALQKAVTARLFEGLQAYLNHPTASEEQERPERDVRYLAGHFREARFVDGNPAEVRAKFIPGGMDKDKVVSLIESALDSPQDKPLVGISIDGYGHTDQQDINGRTYHAVREVTHLGSADIVTRAGAGGQFRRRLQERNPGMAERRPDVSKEATMNAATLQEKVRAAASKLAEAAGLKDDDEKAGGLIDEGLTLLRECADANVEPEVQIQEKRIEVPVAAEKDSNVDELAVKLTEATALLDAEKAAHKQDADELTTLKSAQSALKVIREKQVPDRFRETWFPEIAAQADETAMGAYVDRKLAERAAYIAEFQESVGVEGAGPRPALTPANSNTTGGLLGAMNIDPDLVA